MAFYLGQNKAYLKSALDSLLGTLNGTGFKNGIIQQTAAGVFSALTKSTSVSASSTDTELPTALAVQTALNGKITTPSGGSTGDYLKKTSDGVEWGSISSGSVDSVNGETGTVVLDGSDINVDDTATTPVSIKDEIDSIETDVTALETTVSGHTTSITALQTADTKIKDMVTDAWSEDTAYAVDDYCISANILYRCIAANTGYQPPNVAYWAVTSASAELKRTRRHLLWDNDSPTEAFAAQTVALALSDYSMVLIACRCSTSVDSEATSLCFMDATTCLAARKAGTNYAREATVASTGVTFTTGYTGSTAGTGNLIPIRIYGLV